jgi:hypothetical protein
MLNLNKTKNFRKIYSLTFITPTDLEFCTNETHRNALSHARPYLDDDSQQVFATLTLNNNKCVLLFAFCAARSVITTVH